MIRKLITIGLPLLAPLIVYFAYTWAQYQRREAKAEGRPVPHWQDWPWPVLIGSGVVLLTATLIVTSVLDRQAADAVYSPARFEDGKIVPGNLTDY